MCISYGVRVKPNTLVLSDFRVISSIHTVSISLNHKRLNFIFNNFNKNYYQVFLYSFLYIPIEYGDSEGNQTLIDLLDREVHYQSATEPIFIYLLILESNKYSIIKRTISKV